MADQKLTQLTALASLSADDLFYVVDDPAGAALSRKMAASVLDSRYLQSANNLSDLANAATARINLSLVIGTNVQAWDADLDMIAGLAKADGNFIVGDGAAWTVEGGAVARASLGLGGLATLSSMTLADVAGYSTTTAHQTFALDAGTQVIFEQADGDDILTLYEASRGVQAYGHIAVGGSASIDTGFWYGGGIRILGDFEEVFTDIPNGEYGIGLLAVIAVNPAVNVASSAYYGMEAESFTSFGNDKNIHTLDGIFGGATHFGTGVVGKIVGLDFASFNADVGIVTDVYGIKVGYGDVGGGTITTTYGLKLTPQNSGTMTTHYGIYLANALGTNKFSIVTNAGHAVFNEGSDDDTDFRIEGATDANLLMVDGSADTVQVGAATASDSAKFYVSGKISASGEVEINGALNHDGTELGVFATAPTTQKTVVGSRGGNAALASLLTQLASYGLIIDSSTA